MSIFRRPSGRWAVVIDLEDPQPFRIIEKLPFARDGRRHVQVLAKFRSLFEAEGELKKHSEMNSSRVVSIERIARGRRTVGTFVTKKEAEQAERAVLTAKDRNIDTAPSTVGVPDLVSRYICDRAARGSCGAKTLEEYQRIRDLYIEPHFRSLMVKKLRPGFVNNWVATIMASGGKSGRPISAKSAKHAFALLNASMRWGMKMQLVGQNVCDFVEPPKPQKSQARALTSNETMKLLEAAQGSRWLFFIELALKLGVRRGELLAVSWDEVDFEARTLTIRASLSQTKDTVEIKSTKSGRVREIRLTVAACETFRRLRGMQSADRLRAGCSYVVDARRPVFTNEVGEQLTPKAATNAFARIASKAGIATTSLHSTRHTAATLLIAGGVDVRTTAAILGHSTPNVTLALYAHVVEGAERVAMDVLEDRLESIRFSEENGDNQNTMTREWHAEASGAKKNPRRDEGILVAGTGFEPVTFGL